MGLARSVDKLASIEITRASCLPSGVVDAFFKNPFADLARAKTALQAQLTATACNLRRWARRLCWEERMKA